MVVKRLWLHTRVRIGKTSKKLDDIFVALNAEKLMQRPIGEGDQELEKRLDQKELT
jgi:hypothetical protein